MKIIANDGREGFNTVDECLVYENELLVKSKKEKEERENLEMGKKERYENIVLEHELLIDRIVKYEKDYGSRIYIFNQSSCRFVNANVRNRIQILLCKIRFN